MNKFIITVDTLPKATLDSLCQDTLTRNVHISANVTNAGVNTTWMIVLLSFTLILLLIAVILLYCYHKKKLQVKEMQNNLDLRREQQRQYYKYIDQLLEMHEKRNMPNEKMDMLKKLISEDKKDKQNY